MKKELTIEQKNILENKKKKLIVSASAGSGKTFVVIEYLIRLICENKVPLSKFLVLTFTKAAANEMKTRLYNSILQQKQTSFLLEQIDEIAQSDISTIDAFCEKLIKRNINKLDLDENFLILDEKTAKSLKLTAFERAYEELYSEEREKFNLVYFAFKKNKDMIWECMNDMLNFFDSNFNGDELVEEFICQNEKYQKDGEMFLVKYVSDILNKEKQNLMKINLLPEKYEILRHNLISFCEKANAKDFIELFTGLNDFEFGSMPTNKMDDEEKKRALGDIKDRLKEVKTFAKKFEGLTREAYDEMKTNNLSQALLELYKLFYSIYQDLKKNKSCLDFADLEKVAMTLLKDEEIISSLQDKYEYIFIDEYQDTNFLQEALIKPIAKNGTFVAVGDPKQGIYGFRNASMEIMKKDIEEFSQDEDSDALFLTGNFRSDKRILGFVNKIFVKNMTLDGVGIDYEKTSLLKGLGFFEKGKLPAVCVDIIKEEREEKKINGDYSVKEDGLVLSEKNKTEVKDIVRRVDQMLQSEIYDAKQKAFRKLQPNDIAILFRKRSDIMQQTVKALQEKGISVVADIKQSLLEDSQLRILVSLFKLANNLNDDISLVSLMNSWFGDFSLDEILKIKQSDINKTLYDILIESKDEKIAKFIKDIKNFYFNYEVMGLTKALYKLFAAKGFYTYVNSLDSFAEKKAHIDELFKIIKKENFEYDITALIDYIENNEESERPEGSAQSINVTTIHATKGLEYPVILLCGCGENFSKSDQRQYAISKDFGLATNLYDFEKGEKWESATLVANKLKRKKKDFIEEVLIFYVALTRAQNHLYLIGTQTHNFDKNIDDVFDCKNYFDLVFSSFGKDFTHSLFEKGQKIQDETEFNLIEKIDEAVSFKKNKISKYLSFN